MDQGKHRPPRRLWLASLAGLALLATGCATAANELNPSREALKVAAKPPLGRALADDSGRTVYMVAEWYALTPAGNQAENSTRKGGNGYGS